MKERFRKRKLEMKRLITQRHKKILNGLMSKKIRRKEGKRRKKKAKITAR